jgi:adenylosuccinate lyase
MKRWLQGEDFYENLCKDEDIRQYMTPEEIKACFDPKSMLTHVDSIFARFGL